MELRRGRRTGQWTRSPPDPKLLPGAGLSGAKLPEAEGNESPGPQPTDRSMVPQPLAGSLEAALAAMTFTILPGRWALIGIDGPPTGADVAALEHGPAELVREPGATTLLVRAEHAEAIVARHPGCRIERDLAWVRFDAPMNWEVVGFLALVTGELAKAGVSVGAVCGFHRDHLFVAARNLEKAEAALGKLFRKH